MADVPPRSPIDGWLARLATCTLDGSRTYDRCAGICRLDGADIAAELVRLRLVNSARHSCTATGLLYLGADETDSHFYTCSSGAAYMVQVEPDAEGSVTILDCAVAKLVGVNSMEPFE